MRLQAILSVLLLSMGIAAQEPENTFTVDAQVRARGEYNHGAVFPRSQGERAALYINDRARVSLGYERQHLELRLSAQHTGVWGQDGMKERTGRIAMNEAWAKLKFGGFYTQIGRQQLSYDDERLFGTSDWDVAGNWHDALRIGYRCEGSAADVILAMNQNAANVRGGYYADAMPYKALQALWIHHDVKHEVENLPLEVSLLFMNVGREAGTADSVAIRHMQTFGTYITYKHNDLDAAASFYVQTGKNVKNLAVSAFMASLRCAYIAHPYLKVRAGYDYLSGNDGRNINQHAFEPLYGTAHKFNGAMDYFTGIAPFGLQDIQLGGSTPIFALVELSLDYHHFRTAEKVADYSKSLGHELDFQFSWPVLKDVTLAGGYSFMVGTSTMDFIKGGNHKSWQDWAWLSLSVNPRIFSKKW